MQLGKHNINIKIIMQKIVFACAVCMLISYCVVLYNISSSGLWDYSEHTKVARQIFTNEWRDTPFLHIYAYPLLHIIVKIIAVIFGSYDVAMGVCIVASAIFSVFMLYKISGEILSKEYRVERILLAMATIIYMPATNPLIEWRIYARQCGPNPLHNPTYLVMRPLALLTLY